MTPGPPATRLGSDRRRQLVAIVGRLCLLTVLLVVTYFYVPLGGETSGVAIGIFVGSLVAFGAALVHQIRRIIDDPYPRLRAVETLGAAVPVFIVLFALVYAALAQADTATFTQPVDRLSALYFTVTVLSTVGFGDIAARTDPARTIVTIQMLLDLVLIGVVVRVVIGASRIGTERRRAEGEQGGQDATVSAPPTSDPRELT